MQVILNFSRVNRTKHVLTSGTKRILFQISKVIPCPLEFEQVCSFNRGSQTQSTNLKGYQYYDLLKEFHNSTFMPNVPLRDGYLLRYPSTNLFLLGIVGTTHGTIGSVRLMLKLVCKLYHLAASYSVNSQQTLTMSHCFQEKNSVPTHFR